MLKIIKLLFVIIQFLLLSSCSDTGNQQTLRVGTNIWPGYEPLYLAREQGYFDKKQIHLVEYTSASQVIKAYKNGLLDAAAVTLDEAISLLASGEKLKIVLVMDISNGADALISQPSLKKITDLKGMRIGVEHTALGAYFINRVIDITGIDKNEITVVPLKVNQHERAFMQKKVDAVLTFEPVRTKLLSTGANILFDSSQIPGEIVDVLVVNEQHLAAFSGNIHQLKLGWFKALGDISRMTPTTIKLLGARMQLSTQDVLLAYEGLILPDEEMNEHMLHEKVNPGLLKSSQRLGKVMLDNGLIGSPVDTTKLFLN